MFEKVEQKVIILSTVIDNVQRRYQLNFWSENAVSKMKIIADLTL